jgi:hypothetical protein
MGMIWRSHFLLKSYDYQPYAITLEGDPRGKEEELQSSVFRVVPVLEGSPSIQFGIGYHQRKSLSPAAWAFLRMLAKQENL